MSADEQQQDVRKKPPSSVHSAMTYKTAKSGISKRTTAGRKAVKVIEWYFYPEYASKKLFKNKSVRLDLKEVAGKHYEVLSQASNVHDSYSANGNETPTNINQNTNQNIALTDWKERSYHIKLDDFCGGQPAKVVIINMINKNGEARNNAEVSTNAAYSTEEELDERIQAEEQT